VCSLISSRPDLIKPKSPSKDHVGSREGEEAKVNNIHAPAGIFCFVVTAMDANPKRASQENLS